MGPPQPEARPRKRRGQLDNLPDLTAPMRGFGRDPECLADDPEAEYHGAYTVRTFKLRPGYFCYVWIRDSVLKTEYETTVMVLGFSHDLNSDQPSPYEIRVDVLYTVEHSQVCRARSSARGSVA